MFDSRGSGVSGSSMIHGNVVMGVAKLIWEYTIDEILGMFDGSR